MGCENNWKVNGSTMTEHEKGLIEAIASKHELIWSNPSIGRLSGMMFFHMAVNTG